VVFLLKAANICKCAYRYFYERKSLKQKAWICLHDFTSFIYVITLVLINTYTRVALHFEHSVFTTNTAKTALAVLLVLVQLFAMSVDVLAFETPSEIDTPHHEHCFNDAAGCQTKSNILQNTSESEQCDHCCACHGHFTHMSLVTHFSIMPSSMPQAKLPNYVAMQPSHINSGIERPPRQ